MASRIPNRKTQAPGPDVACALERLEPRLLLSGQTPQLAIEDVLTSGGPVEGIGAQEAWTGRTSTAFTAVGQVYDHLAGKAYAQTWWNGRNTARYYDYANVDCANFVSQCLIAGGLDLSLAPAYLDEYGCIRSCDNLHGYLVNYLGVPYETRWRSEVEPLWFLPGDVAIFGTNSDSWVHAVFAVSGDENHYAGCAAHSSNVWDVKIAQFFGAPQNADWTKCTYYNLSDSSVTPSTEFAAGDRVRATDEVNMRIGPGIGNAEVALPAGCVPAGSVVQIQAHSDNGKAYNGHYWWYVRFDSGANAYWGWCAGDWFERVAQPSVSINDVSQSEGNSGTTNLTFTVSLSQATTVPVTVSYATANGTAVAPGDYGADSGVLTFNPGETAKAVTVGVVGDTTVEPDETFYVNLSGASGATIADAEGQGRILNDDVAVPTIFVNDVMLDEGDVGTKDFTFTITVAGPIGEDVWFSWRLVDGSARVWTDYLPAYGGAHVAQPCSFDATVPVCGDTIVEPEETFFLEIYDVVNATLAVGGGVGTIKNDDLGGIIQFSASGYSVDEDAGAATVTVIRTGGSASDVSVDYATSGDTATPGADYVAASGSVIFGAGEASRNITIPILDDSLVEGSERFNVRLSNPGGGGAIGPQDIAVITIVDREQPADTVKPTATVGHPLNGSVIPLATINVAERYIDVTFDDQGGSGLNYSTITDEGQEFTLSGAGAGGVTVNGMPTLISGGNYRYSFAGDFASGPVNVNFTAGAWADNAGNTNDAEMETFAVGPGIVNAEVVSRHVFYNRSYFDGNNAVANASDDNAIDASKSALLPGSGPATFPNYTSYSRGINGIMVDIDGLADTPNAGDFLFKVGNSNDPLMWATAPGPQNIDVRPGEGDDDSDRVTIIWADNAIQKQWLQVTVLSDANGGSLGLSEEDVFYFGNLPGDATGDGQVRGDDLLALEQGFEQTNATFAEGDFDADGRAGCIDYLTLKRYCGETIALLSPPVMAQAGDSVEILIAEPPIVLSDGNVPLEGPSQGEAVTDEVVAAGSGVRAEVPANIEPTTREGQNDADAALTELPAEPAEITEQAEEVTAQLAWANEQMMAGLMTLSRADRLLNDAPSRWPKTAQAGAGSTVRSAVLNASGKVPAKAIRLVNAETQRVDLLVIASESRTERQPGHGPAVQEEDLLRVLDLTDLTAPALSPWDPWHSRA